MKRLTGFMHYPLSDGRDVAAPGTLDASAATVGSTSSEYRSPTAPTVVIEAKRGLVKSDLRSIWDHRELLYFFVWRDIKVRYKQTAIGAAWAVLQPVLLAAIVSLVFGYFAKLPSDGAPYPLFAFAGLVPWTYFSQALGRTSSSAVGHSNLIQKVYFPRLIIPFSAAVSPLLDSVLSVVVLVGLVLIYGLTPGPAILMLPVFLLIATVTALAVGLWLSAVHVRYRDVGYIIPFLVQIWMYASPVIYPASMVPGEWRAVYGLNPMVGAIEGFRWAVLGSREPAWDLIAVSVGITVILLIGGCMYFVRMARTFADVI